MDTKLMAAAAPPCLSEDDAWAIAMTWQPQLQNRVRLVVDTDGGPLESLVKHYAWVRIGEPCAVLARAGDADHRREVVSVLRAVMVSWAALAACPGFSGSENGAFWKRVVSALQEDHETQPLQLGCGRRRDKLPAITDACGFFDLCGHAFPRFAVETLYTLDEEFTNLFTADGPVLLPVIRDQLASVLARLQNFHSKPVQQIDICLRMHSMYPFTAEISRTLSALVESANASTTEEPTFPRFRISKLDIDGGIQFSGKEHTDGFLELVRAVPVPIGEFIFRPLLNEVTSDDRATWLHAFLRLDGHGVQADVTSFYFPRHYAHDAVFQALLSAMPFARSTHTIAFGTETSTREGGFEQIDLPWIAYGIFHPRAASSSWRRLELTDLTLTEHSAYVLNAMARGNNLLAVLSGAPPTSDAYYSAQLVAGTVVEVTRRLILKKLVSRGKNKALFIVPGGVDVTVDVCGITSLDAATWDKWVAVIVPAYGLGWVRGSELHRVHAHSPATSSLSSLRLSHKYNTGPNNVPDDPPEALLHVLQPLGPMLTYLDIRSYRDVSASTLEAILRACPSLKTLLASHTGELWSDVSITPFETRLEELELSLDYDHKQFAVPTRGHLAESLRNLRTLRLRVWDMRLDQLQASQGMLEQVLCHATTLRYFHWRNAGGDYTYRRLNQPIPYADSLGWTPRALAQLGLTDAQYLYAHRSLSPACAAAFLSVVARESAQQDSRLGCLTDRGVLVVIFQFATSPVRRFLHVEPNDKNPIGETAEA